MDVPGWITNLKRPASLWGAVVGWVCVAIGITGVVLPIIPGIPFLFAGLFILSARYRWASFSLKWLKRQGSKALRRQFRRRKADSELVTTNRG
jgi:uncharacterized membrane protein YbaN (DUF454 family)